MHVVVMTTTATPAALGGGQGREYGSKVEPRKKGGVRGKYF